MTTSVTKLFLTVFVGGILSISVPASAAESPHWTKNGCQSCHVESAPVAGAIQLQGTDAEALCDDCHGDRGDAISCRHASGVPTGVIEIPEIFRPSLKDGKVVCSTCHDVVHQCERPRAHFSFQNRGFLRDRTSNDAGDYCTKCHDSSAYQKLNPHEGTTNSPPRPTCLLCHESMPAPNSDGGLDVRFNMSHDLNDTCLGCHNVVPHPIQLAFGANQNSKGWVHLTKPSAEALERMRESQADTGIELPLNPQTGEIFCATCHNPHSFKVGGEHGSQSSNDENRLRINDICQACHDN